MRTWKCKHCGRKATVSYEDVLDIGTPICCDADMDLLADEPIRIVIQVQGGVVQSVHSSEPGVKVNLLDWDNLNDPGTKPAERRGAHKLQRQAEKMHEVL